MVFPFEDTVLNGTDRGIGSFVQLGTCQIVEPDMIDRVAPIARGEPVVVVVRLPQFAAYGVPAGVVFSYPLVELMHGIAQDGVVVQLAPGSCVVEIISFRDDKCQRVNRVAALQTSVTLRAGLREHRIAERADPCLRCGIPFH